MKLRLTVDGVALEGLAWGVTAGGSGLMAAPARRESDVVVPGRHGVIASTREAFEPTTVVVSMVVLGARPDGTVPGEDEAQRVEFERNLSRLLNLFARRHRPLVLTREVAGRAPQTAEARVVTAIAPSLIAGRAATLSVAFEIPGVFWRGPSFMAQLGVVSGRVTVPQLAGTFEVDDAVLEITGPTAARPRVTDVATGSWIELRRPLASGERWQIHGPDFVCGINNNRTGEFDRSQASSLLTLRSRLAADMTEPCELELSTPVAGLSIWGRGAYL